MISCVALGQRETDRFLYVLFIMRCGIYCVAQNAKKSLHLTVEKGMIVKIFREVLP